MEVEEMDRVANCSVHFLAYPTLQPAASTPQCMTTGENSAANVSLTQASDRASL